MNEKISEAASTGQTTDIRQFFSKHYTVSKRQLGIFLLIVGLMALGGIIAIDLLDVGREGGIGPAQQAALALSALMALVGLSLIPLGDRPA